MTESPRPPARSTPARTTPTPGPPQTPGHETGVRWTRSSRSRRGCADREETARPAPGAIRPSSRRRRRVHTHGLGSRLLLRRRRAGEGARRRSRCRPLPPSDARAARDLPRWCVRHARRRSHRIPAGSTLRPWARSPNDLVRSRPCGIATDGQGAAATRASGLRRLHILHTPQTSGRSSSVGLSCGGMAGLSSFGKPCATSRSLTDLGQAGSQPCSQRPSPGPVAINPRIPAEPAE